MKNCFANISILVLGAAAGAFAQTPKTVKADVPFEFTVDGATMPAGAYVVDTNAVNTITLRAMSSGNGAIVATTNARTLDPQKEARLVFHRYGDQYFLYQVWTTGLNAGRELLPTRQERALAKGPANSRRVIIAASN